MLNKSICLWLLALPFMNGCSHAGNETKPSPEQNTRVAQCERIAPPDDSITVQSDNPHIPGIRMFPASLPGNYSGCGYIWFLDKEGDFLRYTGKFSQGKLIEGTTFIPGLGEPVVCRYTAAAASTDETCSDLEREWRNIPREMEKVVRARKQGRN